MPEHYDDAARGNSFEALRAKILFTEGAHEHTLSRTKFKRRRESMAAETMVGYAMSDGVKGCGKALPTPRKVTPKAEHPHERPEPPKNMGPTYTH